ncbi:hypothetical protein CO666_22740 [Rhizobium chutanense]|uniref:RDD family protein n=1 Tax=Rhizobium chutanense TaxID=2035448 RepID=A0A2A6J7L5_9HYPH|nr:RDD family protein [Rhizobium chutanense]PDT01940.1 hypothetical protein CO666_22740 [Rhizobium chutanense]
MTVWHFEEGQDRKGPISEDKLHDLIKTGRISHSTLLWRQGMDDWQPAGEMPTIAAAFVVPPPLPITHSMSGPCQPQEGTPPSLETQQPSKSRPWPRFWARFIDTLIFTPLLSLAIGLSTAVYAPHLYIQLAEMNEGLLGVLLLPLVNLLLALIMIATGSTPGKAIVGVRVPVPASKSRLAFFLAREMKVWAAGLGLGIPFVALFTQIRQYRLIAAGNTASYDEGNPNILADPSNLRLVAGLAVVAALFTGTVYLRVESKNAVNDVYAKQTWINPVTQLTAQIGRTWHGEEMKTNSGRVFYFASQSLLAEAIVGYEQFGFDGIDKLAYANGIKGVIASDIRINSEWAPLSVQGIPALRATGNAVKADDTHVEVTIAVVGRNAWRMLIFSRGRPVEQLPEKDNFVEAIFGTAN